MNDRALLCFGGRQHGRRVVIHSGEKRQLAEQSPPCAQPPLPVVGEARRFYRALSSIGLPGVTGLPELPMPF